jgi:predicted Zn-ribbon and HTH transcriptional regulator
MAKAQISIELNGDTATGGNAHSVFEWDYDVAQSFEELEKENTSIERTCKKCGFLFLTKKKKAQICPECKPRKHKKQITGR